MNASFFQRLKLLDERIAAGPDACDFARDIDPLLKEDASVAYFYNKLVDPKWLAVLRSANQFDHVPEPTTDPATKTISFPDWSVGGYLERVASQSPAEVVEIIQSLPETANARAIGHLVKASLQLPPQFAAQLASQAQRWLSDSLDRAIFLFDPEQFGELIVQIARGNRPDQALNLANALLALKSGSELDGALVTREPNTRIDLWDYDQIVSKQFPELVGLLGLQPMDLLCALLDSAVELTTPASAAQVGEDYSYIWRPAVEEHSQNGVRGVRDILVTGLRDAAFQLVTSHTTSVEAVVALLEQRRWPIFTRIAIYTLQRFHDEARNLTVRYLLDHEVFQSLNLRHEYTLLARVALPSLAKNDKRTIFNWIQRGPDHEPYRHWLLEHSGRDPSPDELDRYADLWRRDWLARLEPGLTPKWRQRYQDLVAKFGPAEHPEFVSYITTGWVGPESPKTVDELNAMSDTELMALLRHWQVSQGNGDRPFGKPSPEGLGRALATAVQSNPNRFAPIALEFRGLPPTYVSQVLAGFERAADQKQQFPWPAVLGLCQWVITQGSSSQTDATEHGWSWTRQIIARLLTKGLQGETPLLPIELRSNVWKVLEPLTDDADPLPETEERFGAGNTSPATSAINTVRGTALHAVVDYALWIRHYERNLEAPEEENLFALMPEVQAILDKHLNPSVDPSRAVRSVYGQRFPWLVLLDRAWSEQNVPRIFPADVGLRTLRDAAWDAYVVFSSPYGSVFELLREQYALRLTELGQPQQEAGYDVARPADRLAEHLVTLYWQGRLSVETGDLLDQFFEQARETLRAHAIEYVGFSLFHTQESIPSQILERLMRLWSWRFQTITSTAAQQGSGKEECAAFGWWFGSGKFSDMWAIEQLRKVLEYEPRVEANHLVLAQLSRLATKIPYQTLQVLELLLAGNDRVPYVLAPHQEVRNILAAGLRSADPQAQQLAEAVINRLGAAGYLDLGELMSASNDVV